MLLSVLVNSMIVAGAVLPTTPHPRLSTFPLRADTTAESVTQLFTALQGSWTCIGAFADGRKLEADLTFASELDGRALRFRHSDRAPNKYLQDAMWGFDATSNQVVSLSYAAMVDKPSATPGLFVAKQWTKRSITLEADTLIRAPWATNRFTYTIAGDDVLKMVWEVKREAEWRMGDWLECKRAIP